ncbi:YLR088Wp-like protein [Nadsonia fulvescens var. elongata DSM 6958]|uniref:YLR088Wp-like protein n=1 Tax=Nadsonia fulvescens var. elongata DSM 6958 TaxID=857566 RepID=A0A1E3PT35_9ASCO|nr:YLR088Wp-like protein [Nadsonia fulvescens var. elongata DSM 6958]
MGLIEKINRSAAKYGLGAKLIKALPSISCILFLVGVTWLAVLPMEGQYRRTYISENALLPGQVNTYFRETEWDIIRGYRQEVHLLENASEEVRAKTISKWFENIGLKTSTHSWSVEHNDDRVNGSNVYAILHAPRGDTTGAIVLAAPWINQDGKYNDGGIALLVALSKYLKRWSVWSKNIIFVAPSDTRFALREWVTAYHTSLKNTAGSIEGAIILDYESKDDYFDLVEVQYDGLNGQLPNLDLVNTCVQASNYEGLNVIIHGQYSNYDTYLERAKTFGLGLLSQLMAGVERGPGNECFSGWRIDAVTIRAIGTNGPQDITTFGRIAESSLRSINNLLEHFHQSFFFYHLLSPKTFVSIGTYLPAAMCIAQSFPLMAALKWIKGAKAFSSSSTPIDAKIRKVVLKPIALYGLLYTMCWAFSYVCVSMKTSQITSFYGTTGLVIQSIPILSFILRIPLSIA